MNKKLSCFTFGSSGQPYVYQTNRTNDLPKLAFAEQYLFSAKNKTLKFPSVNLQGTNTRARATANPTRRPKPKPHQTAPKTEIMWFTNEQLKRAGRAVLSLPNASVGKRRRARSVTPHLKAHGN
jgi:hypothetical protein